MPNRLLLLTFWFFVVGWIGFALSSEAIDLKHPHLSDDQVIGYIAEVPVTSLNSKSLDGTIAYMHAPRWVHNTSFTPPHMASYDTIEGVDARVLIFDRQVNVDNETVFQYRAVQLLTEEGAARHAVLPIHFHPSYQSIALHQVWVHRQGQQLDAIPFTALYIPQETLEQGRTCSGKVVIVMCVEQLREGDILEYSYSVKGHPPQLQAYTLDAFRLDTPYPIGRAYYRIFGTTTSLPKVQGYNGMPSPELQWLDEDTWELTTQILSVPPTQQEDEQPDWYREQPWVQVSEFTTWEEVAQWAEPLLSSSEKLPEELQNLCLHWQAELPDPRQWVLQAQRYVQEHIVTILEPHVLPAAQTVVHTISMGSGTVYDKGRLLTALLRQLGIDSQIALASRSQKQHFTNWLPTPAVFDHILIQAHIGENSLWLDPAPPFAGAGIDGSSIASYGMVLLTGPEVYALHKLKHNPVQPEVEVYTTYHIDDQNSEVRLFVTSYVRDDNAHAMRALLQRNSRKELSSSLASVYRSLHGELELQQPLVVRDDPQLNEIVLEESYRLLNPWKTHKDGRTRQIWLRPVQLDAELERLQITDRKTPLSLEFPNFVTETVRVVRKGHPWRIKEERTALHTKALTCTVSHKASGDTLTHSINFQALQDSVPVNDLTEHRHMLQTLQKKAEYVVRIPLPLHKRWQHVWPVLITLQSFFGLCLLGAAYIDRYPR